MSGTVVSINVSPDGGVPKHPVDRAMVEEVGIAGDYNWFRSNKLSLIHISEPTRPY